MKERPILFSAPMVRAILDGRKTQTRRVLSPQPQHLQRHEWRGQLIIDQEHRLWCWRGHTFENLWDEYIREADRAELAKLCPLGSPSELDAALPGGRLWVKETIRRVAPSGLGCAVFAVDNAPTVIDTWPWKRDVLTAIHTPRGASRITLEITEVRVQRLQEISEDDARAEGVERVRVWDPSDLLECNRDPSYAPPLSTHAGAFGILWDEINGKRAPWSSNPWVWAISFRRLP